MDDETPYEMPSSTNLVTFQDDDAPSQTSDVIEDDAVAMLAQRDDVLEHFFNFSTCQIRMSSTTPEAVQCHTEYIDRIAQLVHSDSTSIATADSGANTNFLGRDWLIVSEYPFHTNCLNSSSSKAMLPLPAKSC
jgi:hypothetical protein